MAWHDVIDDRTQADVDFARYIIENLKGVFNAVDLNRVEENIKYLSDELNKLGYTNSVVVKSWNIEDLPTEADITRIIGNLRKLISIYSKSSQAPELPSSMLHFQQINDLEKNLKLLKQMIDNYYLTLPKVGAMVLGNYPQGNRQKMNRKGGNA